MAIAFGLIGVPAKRNGLSMQFCLGKEAKLTMLSTTNVINTELILNISSVVLGFVLIALIKIAVSLTTKSLSKMARNALCLLLLVLAALPLSGEIILACMKLGILGLDKGLLSYVSKVTNFSWILSYAVLALVSICVTVFSLLRLDHYKSR